MVKAIDVAKLFLGWATRDGDLITNLKLQKLLYYAQAWYLVNSRRRLYEDKIEAWEFGPVIRSLYSKWKRHGNSPIPYKLIGNEESPFGASQISFLKEFYSIFSNISATNLVNMSHNETPWKDAYSMGQNTEISTSSMMKYYTELYERL